VRLGACGRRDVLRVFAERCRVFGVRERRFDERGFGERVGSRRIDGCIFECRFDERVGIHEFGESCPRCVHG